MASETAEIPYQINHSDRIVIGKVSEIDTHYGYTIHTITVKEWLYNPFPVKTIKVRTEIGTNAWTEDEAEFILNESVLLMLKDENLGEQLFRVATHFPGKHPVSDKDAVIEELKAQGKWQEENQTVNEINNSGVAENVGTVSEQEEDQNKANNTMMMENTATAGEQEEKSNTTQESKSAPFISPVLMLAAVLGAVIYARKK
ncbi:hypothetical protein ACSAZL_13545 [Methanosarcina sp. T3]|uniref:hypothetical protein n=1 Tax=Methanosarcina sp. T3 TaxID=3439062 RepID=UPI003F851608